MSTVERFRPVVCSLALAALLVASLLGCTPSSNAAAAADANADVTSDTGDTPADADANQPADTNNTETAAHDQTADANEPAGFREMDPNELKEHATKLAHQMDTGNLKEVMSAFNELMEIGVPAVRPIVKMANQSRSRTTRVRSRCMIHEIIKRAKEDPLPETVDSNEFPWTDPVAGIAMRLSVDRDVYEPKQPVRMRIDFRNTTDKPVKFAPLALINLPRGGGGGRVQGKLSFASRKRYPTKPREYEPTPLERTLKPGETTTWWFRLNEDLGGQYKVMLMHDRLNNFRAGLPLPRQLNIDMPLTVGTTGIRFTYYAASRGLLKGAKEDLSATVQIKVSKKHEDKDDGDE